MGFLDRLFGGKRVLPERVRDLDAFKKVVLKSEIPVILDVWSTTCAPCKKLEPVLIDIATRYEGRVRVVEVCTADTDPRVIARLGVRSTPTLIMFDRGEEIGRASGWKPAEWFDQMIATELS